MAAHLAVATARDAKLALRIVRVVGCELADRRSSRLSRGELTCAFRKFHPAWIRIVRQNHRIIEYDVCDPVRAWNVRRRPVQVAEPA